MSLTVLVHAGAVHVRLQLVDGLREFATVVPTGADPIRDLRSHRPDVVLVALRRRDRRQKIALARSLKTDGRQPPLLGLIDPGGVLSDPEVACERAQADGCLVGALDAGSLRRLVSSLSGPSCVVIQAGAGED